VVLTATAGTWVPTPTKLNYQRKRAGVIISGATGKTYRVRPVDAGSMLTVTVTAKRTSYKTAARQSASTAKVAGLAYKNCAALKVAYPNGAAKAGVRSTWSANGRRNSSTSRSSPQLFTR
jgi:hypothetical protein